MPRPGVRRIFGQFERRSQVVPHLLFALDLLQPDHRTAVQGRRDHLGHRIQLLPVERLPLGRARKGIAGRPVAEVAVAVIEVIEEVLRVEEADVELPARLVERRDPGRRIQLVHPLHLAGVLHEQRVLAVLVRQDPRDRAAGHRIPEVEVGQILPQPAVDVRDPLVARVVALENAAVVRDRARVVDQRDLRVAGRVARGVAVRRPHHPAVERHRDAHRFDVLVEGLRVRGRVEIGQDGDRRGRGACAGDGHLERVGAAVGELGRAVELGDVAGHADQVAELEVVGIGPRRPEVGVDAVGSGSIPVAGRVLEEEAGRGHTGDAALDVVAMPFAGGGRAGSLELGDGRAGGRRVVRKRVRRRCGQQGQHEHEQGDDGQTQHGRAPRVRGRGDTGVVVLSRSLMQL